MIDLSIDNIKEFECQFGSAFYIFNEQEFIDNYRELESTFKEIYPNYNICYSYKTNYTPSICKCVKELGGYAEVVSDMEYELALKLGYTPEKIIFNGPYKCDKLEYHILNGGINNIDNYEEALRICEIKKKNREKRICSGIRINFDLNAGYTSRFGIDVNEIEDVIKLLRSNEVIINGFHCHYSRARDLKAWEHRTNKMIKLIDDLGFDSISYISLGSGMYGQMDDDLRKQFPPNVPSYKNYADCVFTRFADYYRGKADIPIIFTEPGTTLVSKYVDFIGKVIGIKKIRGKMFVTMNCSFHNLGETCTMKNLPIKIFPNSSEKCFIEDSDFVGYTCLEQDVLFKNYTGEIGVGDYVLFGNVGGYSVVDKPPFIQPNYPIIAMKDNSVYLAKRKENFENIFSTFIF